MQLSARLYINEQYCCLQSIRNLCWGYLNGPCKVLDFGLRLNSLLSDFIGRVSNVTLCHEVPNFLFLFINFRWGEVSCFICLINPLEGLLVKLLQCLYILRVVCKCIHSDTAQFYSALRNVVVFLLPHTMVAAKQCRTTQGLPLRPVRCHFRHKSSSKPF